MNPNNPNSLPPFGEISNQHLHRQLSSLSSPYNIPTSIGNNASVPSTRPQMQPLLSALSPALRSLPQPMEPRTNYHPFSNIALPQVQQEYRSISSNLSHQNGFAYNATLNPPTQPPPQQHFTAHPTNANAANFQNSSNRGDIEQNIIRGSQPITNQGPITCHCCRINDQLSVRLAAATLQNDALKAQLKTLGESRQADFNQYKSRIHSLQHTNNTLREISKTSVELSDLRQIKNTTLQKENIKLKENAKNWSECVQSLSASLKTSILIFQNNFGIRSEAFERNEATSDQDGVLFAGQKELLELNKVASHLEKMTQNIGAVPVNEEQNLLLPPPPQPLFRIPLPNSGGTQVSTIENLHIASPSEQTGAIRLTFSDEEDETATVLQTNHVQLPAIASTSKQAAIRDLQDAILFAQHKQTLSQQQRSVFPVALVPKVGNRNLDGFEFQQRGQESEDVVDDDSDCLVIDESGELDSSEQPIDDENGEENIAEIDGLHIKKRKLVDEILSIPAVHEQVEDFSGQRETALNGNSGG